MAHCLSQYFFSQCSSVQRNAQEFHLFSSSVVKSKYFIRAFGKVYGRLHHVSLENRNTPRLLCELTGAMGCLGTQFGNDGPNEK